MSLAFSNTTDKNGIIQIIEFNTALGDGAISGDATLLKQITAQVNQAMSEVWHIMWSNQSGWAYDDANQTNLPQATFNLVASQAKYALPSEALTVNRIEVKDKEGNFYPLTPLVEREIHESMDEFFETDGMPQYYRLVGRTIEMFPAPSSTDTTLTAGGKIYFDRTGISFVSTDTTATPGFSAEYHDLIPTKASIKWLRVHKPDSPTLILLQNDEIKRESQLKEFEVNKFKDREPVVLRGRRINSR